MAAPHPQDMEGQEPLHLDSHQDRQDQQATRPPGPPGPHPDRADLLAQMVAAMQATAAGLPGPGARAPPPPLRVKIPPPIFKGLPEERPEAHLLRTNDWMDTYQYPSSR